MRVAFRDFRGKGSGFPGNAVVWKQTLNTTCYRLLFRKLHERQMFNRLGYIFPSIFARNA